MKFRTIAILAGAALGVAAMSGCAVKAPSYAPSITNVSTLKTSGTTPVALGTFSVRSGTAGGSSISLRGHNMRSPVGADYAAYVAEALRADLEMAKRLDPKSTIEITGLLLKNEVDANGMSKGDGEIQAQFIVRRDGQVRFDKVKSGKAEWESSFAGAVAIPRAAQNYPFLVQSLLSSLYADADFVAAIR